MAIKQFAAAFLGVGIILFGSSLVMRLSFPGDTVVAIVMMAIIFIIVLWLAKPLSWKRS